MERRANRIISIFIVFILILVSINTLINLDSVSKLQSNVRSTYDDISSEYPSRGSGGQLYVNVFSEDFETNLNQWHTTTGVERNTQCRNAPSPTHAANLDGGGDELRSNNIDISDYGYGFMAFFIQCQGNGDLPEAGDYLNVEMYLDGSWQNVKSFWVSPRYPTQYFYPLNLSLPNSAFRSDFKFRFLTNYGSGSGTDDWFVDDIKVMVNTGILHMSDSFPNANLNNEKWPSTSGSPVVNSNAQNEPSASYSLNLDGSGDTVTSNTIDLSRYSGGYVAFFYQEGDGGANRDDPEEEDVLIFEGFNNRGEWQIFGFMSGFMAGYSKFQLPEFPIQLPVNCFHPNFKFRINSANGDSGLDDWFIDDIELITMDYYVEAFSDDFDSGSLDNELWTSTPGTPQVNQQAEAEPSSPYSLNLDGSGDSVVSKELNLDFFNWVSLQYDYQQGGSGHGDKPESGDELYIDFKLEEGWKTIKYHRGLHPRNSIFMNEEIPILDHQLHQGFQIRFRTNQGDGANTDDWFIDNVRVVGSISVNPSSLMENFDGGVLNLGDWEVYHSDAQVNEDAHNPPTGDYTMNLDGEKDIVTTKGFDLSFYPSARIHFYWQQGNGDGNNEPDANDDLFADILMTDGWFTIFHAKGQAGGTDYFTNFSFILPQQSLLPNFKLRFRVSSNDGNGQDDWFIDNVYIGIHQMGYNHIGLYCGHSDTGNEGTNPIKALASVDDRYTLSIFNNWEDLASNLSRINLLIISEQELLGPDEASTLADNLENPLISFLEMGKKIMVCDGGEGSARLIVRNFVESTASQTTYGTIRKNLPEHGLVQNLPTTFNSISDTAFFEDVDGRKVLTIDTSKDEDRPVLVEKRYARGSIILCGFDFSLWNSNLVQLLQNTIGWQIINDFAINDVTIDNENLYAAHEIRDISVDIFDTIGPEDVERVDISFFNDEMESDASIAYVEGDVAVLGGDDITVDSWYTETTPETMVLHLNVSFGWDFPLLGSIGANVTVNSNYMVPVNYTSSNLFNFDNELKFKGNLIVLDQWGDETASGSYAAGGSTLVFSGINVVYNTSNNIAPLDEELDVRVVGSNGDYWTDMNVSDGISLEVNVSENATFDPYTYHFMLSGNAEENLVGANLTFDIHIDNLTPIMYDPLPSSGSWNWNSYVNCSIMVNDTGGSGVRVADIFCRHSRDNGQTWSNWSVADGLTSGDRAWKIINLSQGKNNIVQWKMTDKAGNFIDNMNMNKIWVDSEPVEFNNYSPSITIYTLDLPCEVECSVIVTDNMSGVNPSEGWIRLMDDNSQWGEWNRAVVTPGNGSYELSFFASFNIDGENRIQWACKDMAGVNNLSAVWIINVDIPKDVAAPMVTLMEPLNRSNTDLTPDLEWELKVKTGLGIWTPFFNIFLSNTSDIDTYNGTHYVTTNEESTFNLDMGLVNGTVYYWKVVPYLSVVGTDIVKMGTCSVGYYEFTALSGFRSQRDFNFLAEFDQVNATYLPGETLIIEVTLQNIGNNLDYYELDPNDEWNYSGFDVESIGLFPSQSRVITLSFPLMHNISLGNYTLNITIKSIETDEVKYINETFQVIAVRVVTDDDTDDDSDNEETDDDEGYFSGLWLLIWIGLALIIILLLIILIKRKKDDEDDGYKYIEDDDEDDEDDDDLFDRIKKDVGISGDEEDDIEDLPDLCEKCGETIPNDVSFCPYCGTKKLTPEEKEAKKKLLEDDDLDQLLAKASQVAEEKEEEEEDEKQCKFCNVNLEKDGESLECNKCGSKYDNDGELIEEEEVEEEPQDEKPKKKDIYEELFKDEEADEEPTDKSLAPPGPPRSIDDVSSVDELLDDIVVVSAPSDEDEAPREEEDTIAEPDLPEMDDYDEEVAVILPEDVDNLDSVEVKAEKISDDDLDDLPLATATAIPLDDDNSTKYLPPPPE